MLKFDGAHQTIMAERKYYVRHGLVNGRYGVNWSEIEQRLPTMNREQLIDSLKMCFQLIQRMERELGDGARTMDEMTALLHKLTVGKSAHDGP
jgi:hypothetical protein